MTEEELLKPRYKIIADYPDSIFKVGGILLQGETELTEAAKYPHLFKKLEWWEDRKEEDMPEYYKRNGSSFLFNELEKYYKPFSVLKNNEGLWASFGEGLHIHLAHLLPATKEEYEAQ